MGPESNVYIVPYGVVYDPSRPKRVKREGHLLVWSYSNQVGGIKRIKRVRLYYVCAAPSGRVLVWKRVYAHFGLESGVVFEGTTAGSVWTYLSFQFQMSKKEREICEF